MQPSLAPSSWVLSSVVFMFLNTCTPDETPPVLNVSAIDESAQAPLTTTQKLENLDAICPDGSKRAVLMADVRHMLLAQIATEHNDLKAAQAHWFEALKLAEGEFGALAFAKWLQLYVKTLDTKVQASVLARLVHAETNKARLSSYMLAEGLDDEFRLLAKLEALVPDEILLQGKKKDLEPASLSQLARGFDDSDPLLRHTAELYCSSHESMRKQLDFRGESLDQLTRSYWLGLKHACLEEHTKAIEHLTAAIEVLGSRAKTRNRALHGYRTLIRSLRVRGKREMAARYYIELMDLWKQVGLSPLPFQTSQFNFDLGRIDDTLWAARYTSLVGDLRHGEVYAQDALTLISNALGKHQNVSEKNLDRLYTFQAEAYHILASRVAVEKREFDQAIALSNLGLQIPGLDKEWQERFLWYIGLYNYISGDAVSAYQRWQELLEMTETEHLRSQLYFWLAQSLAKQKQKEQSQFYLQALVDEFPLSFYSVAALKLSELPLAGQWQEIFLPTKKLLVSLTEREKFDLELFTQHEKVGPLLRRAEILIAADLRPWTKLGVSELTRAVRKTFLLNENSVSAFVYLTRLQYAVGSHLDSISLSTQIIKTQAKFWQFWPEHLITYYPQPFSAVFAQAANTSGISEDILLAITRQESSFQPSARSGVGALGLMQLMPETARKVAAADQQSFDGLLVLTDLARPEINVSLGAQYIKQLMEEYKGYLPASLAAYNAGEYAVNRWIDARSHSDPLVWLELIPFGETKGYVKGVWRNLYVYQFLRRVKADRSKYTIQAALGRKLGGSDSHEVKNTQQNEK